MTCSIEERGAAENLVTNTPRLPKEVLLPQMAAMAFAGRSCRQIAATFGRTKSTVHRWLQEMREDCPTRFAGCAEIVAAAVAGYWSLHDEALEGLRLSQADKVTKRVAETATARGSKKKRTVRTETQAGKPAFLGTARRALDGIARIAAKIAPRGGEKREQRRKGGKERDKGASVPRPEGAPIGGNALREGELGDFRTTDPCVSATKCPTGSTPRTGAAEASHRKPIVSFDAEMSHSRSAERKAAERPDLKVAKDVQWPGHGTVRTRTKPRSDHMGHPATTRLYAELFPAERQPACLGGFSDWHTLPMAETGCTIRGKTRRQKAVNGANCPIPRARTDALFRYAPRRKKPPGVNRETHA